MHQIIISFFDDRAHKAKTDDLLIIAYKYANDLSTTMLLLRIFSGIRDSNNLFSIDLCAVFKEHI